MGLWLLWALLLCGEDHQSGLPPLPDIFLENRRESFLALLAPGNRVECELAPLLRDSGKLSNQQLGLAFAKLQRRYRVIDAQLVNSQGDTNYAWLEIHLRVRLIDTRAQLSYNALFAFHFKYTASRLALSRWILQDLY